MGMAKLANKNVSSHCAKIVSSAFYHVMMCNTLNSNITISTEVRSGTGKALLLKKVLYFTYLN